MKRYKAIFTEVREVEIERETDKQVVLKKTGFDGKPMREAKTTDYYSYHHSFESAKQAVIDERTEQYNKAKARLDGCAAAIAEAMKIS